MSTTASHTTHSGHAPVTPQRTEGRTTGRPNGAFRYAAAATRLALGWVFLWAFLDKLFALGFATGRNPKTGVVDAFGPAAWIHGGSPTLGFLKFGTTGPLAGFYQSFAGATWANWLFMIGLAGIGVALILGIGMRVATISAVTMVVLMWSAALWPPNNPFMDEHLVYALALLTLLFADAGKTLGLGRAWERLQVVQRYPILK